MSATTLAKRAIAVQYTLLRAPVDALAQRVPRTSGIRYELERKLAALDATAGRILDDPALERRGEEVLESIETVERTQRRVDAVDRRTAAKEERVERQTRKAVEQADAQREQARDNRKSAAEKRRDARVLDQMAENVKQKR